jgi:hypothetical protein
MEIVAGAVVTNLDRDKFAALAHTIHLGVDVPGIVWTIRDHHNS